MATLLPDSTSASVLIIVALVTIATFSKNYLNKGFFKYHGPFSANFTDAWRFFSVYRGKSHLELRELHDRHGEIVRLGPNSLSFSTPEAVKAIYGLNHRLKKVGKIHHPL